MTKSVMGSGTSKPGFERRSRNSHKGFVSKVRIERCELRTGSGVKELWRKVTPLGLCKKDSAKRTVAYSPVRIDKRTDRFYGELDRRLRKGGR